MKNMGKRMNSDVHLLPFLLALLAGSLISADYGAVAAADSPRNGQAGEHQPRFSIKHVQDIACRGKKWNGVRIHDNGERIADIVADPKIYPPSVARAINVKLSPTSNETIRWWDIMHRGGDFSDNTLRVDDSNPQELKMTFAAKVKKQAYEVRGEAVLTYDNELNSYVYEVTIEKVPERIESYALLADAWESFHKSSPTWRKTTRSEGCYCNLDCGRGVSHFVYQDRDGGLTKVPHHSLLAPDKYNIRLRKGGAKAGFLGNHQRALMIELLGETANHSDLALCNAGFDLWLNWILQPGRNVARAKFKIYSYDKKRADEYSSDARIPPFTDEEFATLSLPAYQADRHPISDFESGVDLRKHDRRAFWAPYGRMSGMQWCRSLGHSGTGSLKTHTDKEAECFWEVSPLAVTHRYIEVPAGSPAVVSVWIRTETLQGEGAYFKAGFCRSYSDWLESVQSRKLTGTSDWTEVSVELPPLEEKGRVWLRVKLVHNGKGTSYFDDMDCKFINP